MRILGAHHRRPLRIGTAVFALVLAAARPCAAQGRQAKARPDTSVHLHLEAFVDSYFAYDFDRPAHFDRAFTTQPARHDEFNVNLAYAAVTLAAPRVHGRLAIQYGTSVQANYATEPRIGTVSGPAVARFIQEAYGGVRIARGLSVDAGIFFSHIGSEGWISRDQWTYTRSLIAEFTPYYESGVRAVWTPAKPVTVTGVVVNGWQNISETNSAKSGGVRIDVRATPAVTVTYDNYFGNDAPDSAPARPRIFQELILTARLANGFGIAATGDYGLERRAAPPGFARWSGFALVAREPISASVAVNGRIEDYSDPEQVIVAAPSAVGFQARGASIGIDVAPVPRVLWRTEYRFFRATHAVYPDPASPGGRSPGDSFIVTSLALTF